MATLALAACSLAPDVLEPNHFPQAESINRGGAGYLTPAELDTLQGLAWPQTYGDMTGTFGLANRSTETKDIYRLQGTNQEVWIYYSGRQATGYAVRP